MAVVDVARVLPLQKTLRIVLESHSRIWKYRDYDAPKDESSVCLCCQIQARLLLRTGEIKKKTVSHVSDIRRSRESLPLMVSVNFEMMLLQNGFMNFFHICFLMFQTVWMIWSRHGKQPGLTCIVCNWHLEVLSKLDSSNANPKKAKKKISTDRR